MIMIIIIIILDNCSFEFHSILLIYEKRKLDEKHSITKLMLLHIFGTMM